MAKRMFDTRIVSSDPFLDMPPSSQALYFHLGIHADDDGFVYPRKVMREVSANDDDLKILLAKKFLLSFESGVVVQKHWRVNNYIRADRYRPTTHRDEMALLSKDKGMVYHMSTDGIPSGRISNELSNKVKEDFFEKENAEMQDANINKSNVDVNSMIDRTREKLEAKGILRGRGEV